VSPGTRRCDPSAAEAGGNVPGLGPGAIIGSDPREAADAQGRPRRWVDGPPRGRFGPAAALVWLAFIVFPLIDAVTNKGPVVGHVLAIVGAALFVVIYVWLVMHAFGARQSRLTYAMCGVMVLLAILLTVLDRPSWGFLFTYAAACAAVIVPSRLGYPAVISLTVLAAAAHLIGGGTAGGAFGYGASTIGIGLLMVLMRDLRMRNAELLDARAELARVAVAEERERFARDLHDLLGHSLSVIALKAELAGKLLDADPERAGQEVGELETVARQALREVRLAVGGYRQPTLDGELGGARLALAAAGIDTEVERAAVTLAPEVEGALAWAIREGATNVIRHSGARECMVRIGAGLTEASVEVLDDGGGCAGSARERTASAGVPSGGNGLIGLRERSAALGGRLEAGTRPEGGFRLAIYVPVAPAGATGHAPAEAPAGTPGRALGDGGGGAPLDAAGRRAAEARSR
jgi:two-component system sensor histidine kinase DesK